VEAGGWKTSGEARGNVTGAASRARYAGGSLLLSQGLVLLQEQLL